MNQLDGRKVEAYPPGTIIPNPHRRRIERALRLARSEEGDARNRLAATNLDDKKRVKLEVKLRDVLVRRDALETIRPHVPKQIAVEKSELANTLVRHTGELKAIVDTIRIVCANVETELAAIVAPFLSKAREAKKVIANLFAAPGRVEVAANQIRVSLAPAANRTERRAIAELLAVASSWDLTLPGDLRSRPLRFLLQVS